MKTCSEKALEWNVTPRTVNAMCKNGRIQGAVKEKRTWLIPDDAEKPLDGRISTGKYSRKKTGKEKKTLPVGISDYVRAQSEYYYVDKTLLIKEFLDRKPLVSLFTRPRRFGKTLNMDMLRVFFEISEDDTSKYFTDKAIWKCGEKYRRHQGKYPVILKNDAAAELLEAGCQELDMVMNLQRCKIRYVGSNHRQNPRITSGRIWEASGITEQ